ncbi:unnamed protein product, partial [Polarella glacialis]
PGLPDGKSPVLSPASAGGKPLLAAGKDPLSVDARLASTTTDAVDGEMVPAAVNAVVIDVLPPVRSDRSYKGAPAGQAYTPDHDAASEKIGKVARGIAARHQVKAVVGESRPKEEFPLDPKSLGFVDYAENNDFMPKVADFHRFKVRDVTMARVFEQLGSHESMTYWNSFADVATRLLKKIAREGAGLLPPGPRLQMHRVHLFEDKEVNPIAEAAEGFRAHRQDQYLLGQFDVVAVPAIADFDAAFQCVITADDNPDHTQHQRHSSRDCDSSEGFDGWFWVLHQAAPNIGESSLADDFVHYSKMVEELDPSVEVLARKLSIDSLTSMGSKEKAARCCWKDRPSRPRRRLDEDLYIGDMSRLWRQALLAMAHLGVDDAIFFPFGMGAFLRHLNLNDDIYEDPKRVRALKRRIADELLAAIADLCVVRPDAGGVRRADVVKDATKAVPTASSSSSSPSTNTGRNPMSAGPARVHLCLVCVNPESVENHNCFVEAAAELAKTCPGLAQVVLIRRNVDSLELARHLSRSNGNKLALKVGLLNGANRKLCGNHWFQGGARFAIDENLHRRSASMARAALLLNFDTEPRPRRPSQLADTVRFLGGSVLDIADLYKRVDPLGNAPKLVFQSVSKEGVQSALAPSPNTQTDATPGDIATTLAKPLAVAPKAKSGSGGKRGGMFACCGGGANSPKTPKVPKAQDGVPCTAGDGKPAATAAGKPKQELAAATAASLKELAAAKTESAKATPKAISATGKAAPKSGLRGY